MVYSPPALDRHSREAVRAVWLCLRRSWIPGNGTFFVCQCLQQRRRMHCTNLGYVLREMGLHAHLLEYGGGSFELLSLHDLSRESRTERLPLEPLCLDRAVHLLSLRLLGLGHDEQPEE